MKLLCDVNVSPLVVEQLRRRGYDAIRVTEFVDARTQDEAIVALAVEQQAVLVSRDQDFSQLVALSGATQPSLINVRVTAVSPLRIAQLIALILEQSEQDVQEGAIVTIDDHGIRVHRLPVEV